MPVWVIRLEAPHIGDPPDVVAGAVLVRIRPVHRTAGQVLARCDRLDHRAVGIPAAADVVDGAGPRRLHEMPEGVDQVPGMDVVADLLSLVAEYFIGLARNGAFDEIGE